jgi:nitroreductase
MTKEAVEDSFGTHAFLGLSECPPAPHSLCLRKACIPSLWVWSQLDGDSRLVTPDSRSAILLQLPAHTRKDLIMSVYELMKQRCSVRKFEDRPVEKEKLLQVLDSARVAPSACNNQPWHFVVVQDDELRKKISGRWGEAAPAIIVICGNHDESWHRGDGKDHCDIDAAIAIDHMSLMAAELGLGTCWVCSFDAAGCHKTLGLPENLEAIALLPIGYPIAVSDPNRHDDDRKTLDEIVSWDGYTPKDATS